MTWLKLSPMALAGALLSASALADEAPVEVPCGPLAKLPEATKFRPMSHDEWMAARAVFFSAPSTPTVLPPGDRGLIEARDDGSAYLAFVDGDEACGLIMVSKGVADLFGEIRAGVITHPPGRM